MCRIWKDRDNTRICKRALHDEENECKKTGKSFRRQSTLIAMRIFFSKFLSEKKIQQFIRENNAITVVDISNGGKRSL